MKYKISFIIVIAAAIISGISSCKKDDNDVVKNDNDVIKRYLEIKSSMGSFQKNNGDVNKEALMASIMRHHKKSSKAYSDSGWVDTGWVEPIDTTYWQIFTCATVTEYVDDNGKNVTVYDYGQDGCEDWGSFFKGKVTYIWSQTNDVYFSKVMYENYYAFGMTMNGYSEYSYSFVNMTFENGKDSTISNFDMSGSSSCIEDIEMIYDGGETYHYTANYSSEWEEKSYTVHEGEYSYKNLSNGYEYTYKVTEELFSNYECGYEIFVPVRGIEEIIYKDFEIDTKFVTNYGDGTCDNIAVINENGNEYTIDFGELWYSQPCEEPNCDSMVVYVEGKN